MPYQTIQQSQTNWRRRKKNIRIKRKSWIVIVSNCQKKRIIILYILCLLILENH